MNKCERLSTLQINFYTEQSVNLMIIICVLCNSLNHMTNDDHWGDVGQNAKACVLLDRRKPKTAALCNDVVTEPQRPVKNPIFWHPVSS